MRSPYAIGLATIAMVAAACGSTVQPTGTASSQLVPGTTGTTSTSGDEGLSVPGGSGAAAPASTGTGTGTGTTATGTTPTPGGASTGPGTTGTTETSGQLGPGITASTIYMGDYYSSQLAAVDTAIGASGDAPSYDYRNVTNSIIDYANKHGGFAGRQLKAIWYNLNLANPRPSEDAAACAKWTQDNKVFAMSGATDEYRQCAEKAGAVSILSGNSVASTFKKYPHFVDPISIRLDRMGPVTVGGLYKAHYFTGKLGLITWDDPNYRYAMTQGYLPALASHGIKPATAPIYVSVTQDANSVAQLSAEMRSAVAKFKALGIDHVIIQDGPAGVWAGGGLTLEFMNNAKSQQYYPRYGGNSYNIPGNSELPADEQNHELAILDTDSDPENDAGWHLNSQRELCFKIEKQAGLSPKNDEDRGLAAQTCDVIFFLQRLVNAVVPTVNADTVINQVARLGTSFAPAAVYGTNFFPGRRDGSDKVRLVQYFQSCDCLKYSGPPYQPD
jgi:hypothetical protein